MRFASHMPPVIGLCARAFYNNSHISRRERIHQAREYFHALAEVAQAISLLQIVGLLLSSENTTNSQ